MIDKINRKTQNAIVRGRQILDVVLIANECVESRLRAGSSGLLVKLDMEKAYYHVEIYLHGRHGSLVRSGVGGLWHYALYLNGKL